MRSNEDAKLSMMGAEGASEGSSVLLQGNPDPKVVAHELFHTVQQRSASPTAPGDSHERAADQFAADFVSGNEAGLQRAAAATADAPIAGTGRALSPSRGNTGGTAEFLDAEARGSASPNANVRYTPTESGGWVDRDHMSAHAENATATIDQITGHQPVVSVTSSPHAGPIALPFTTRYHVNYAAMPAEVPVRTQRETLAVAMIAHHDIAFEMNQGQGIQHASSFTFEDLPSDRIGTEVGIRTRRMWMDGSPSSTPALPAHGAAAMPHSMEDERLRPYYLAALTQVMGELGPTQTNAQATDRFNADGRSGLIDAHNHTARPMGLAHGQAPAPFLSGAASPAWVSTVASVEATSMNYESSHSILQVLPGPLPATPTTANVARTVTLPPDIPGGAGG